MTAAQSESDVQHGLLPHSARSNRIVTIWASYGPYHVARVNGLKSYGFEVVPFSYCTRSEIYPFFSETLEGNVVINDCEFHQVNPLRSLIRTLRLLNKYRPDAVVACGYERPETLAALIYAKIRRLPNGARPTVVLMAENQFGDRPRRLIVEAVKSMYLRFFDGFVVGGSRHRDYLLRLGVRPDRIRLGYDCVDNAAIERLASEYRQSSDLESSQSPYFICVARLIAKKNIATLVSAYDGYRRSLANDVAPWRLVICGDGPDRPLLDAQLDSLALGHLVHLAGQTERFEDTVRYLAHSAALILPSSIEPWGLVVNEAMAAQLPVLVSRQCGCSPELVEEGQNGFTFDCDDADDLARKMLWMHSHQRDLRAMGQKSREIIERYSPKQFADSVASIGA